MRIAILLLLLLSLSLTNCTIKEEKPNNNPKLIDMIQGYNEELASQLNAVMLKFAQTLLLDIYSIL